MRSIRFFAVFISDKRREKGFFQILEAIISNHASVAKYHPIAQIPARTANIDPATTTAPDTTAITEDVNNQAPTIKRVLPFLFHTSRKRDKLELFFCICDFSNTSSTNFSKSDREKLDDIFWVGKLDVLNIYRIVINLNIYKYISCQI